MNGIDIASFQAGINLSVVPCDFVIIKATQGTTYVNPDWRRAYEQAQRAGKLVGLYHYASRGGGKAEAMHFLKTIGDAAGKAMLVLDWENGSGRHEKNDNFHSVAYAKEWLDHVRVSTNSVPMIYMSKSVCRQFDWSSVASTYPLWAAQYGSRKQTGYQTRPWTDRNGYGAWRSPAIQQYSSNGRLPGWQGALDLDLAHIDREQWQQLVGGAAPEVEEKKPDTERMTMLRRGARNKDVKILQTALNMRGFRCLIDGIFGRETEWQVKKFQESRNLQIDGIVGRNTWAELFK